jgi:shikimate kinase
MARTQQKVLLVGPSGAGKSAVVQEAAALVGIAYFDLDACVCAATHSPDVQTIWSQYGEQYFRTIELMMLTKILALPCPALIATGAGVVEQAS